MNNYQPTVIYPLELARFIQHLLEHHGTPTTLIICGTEDAFIGQLHTSIAHEKDLERQEAELAGLDQIKVSRIASRKHALLIPTIHQLATSRTIGVTFCATLAQLHACIGVHGIRGSKDTSAEVASNSSTGPPSLVLLNPLQLHCDTSSFSAQGLSRTFASAVEAASRMQQKLIVLECVPRLPLDVSSSPAPAHPEDDDTSVEQPHESGGANTEDTDSDPWEQRVAILNVTTKSFGAGERGWVGRTVQVKRVVGRWCVFEKLDV